MINRVLTAFVVIFLGSACSSSPSLIQNNPKTPIIHCKDIRGIVIEDHALLLHNSERFLLAPSEIDLLHQEINRSLYPSLAQTWSIPNDSVHFWSDSLWTKDEIISKAWDDKLWFRAHWPLYHSLTGTDHLELILHRIDIGTDLNAKQLFSANSQQSPEEEVDTILPNQRQWPHQLQVNLCWTIWDRHLSQYQQYGCQRFAMNFDKASPMDTILPHSTNWDKIFQNWKISICKTQE